MGERQLDPDDLADRIVARLRSVLPDDRPLLSIEDVAKRLGVSGRYVRSLVAEQDGRPARLESFMQGGKRMVEPRALDRYVAQLKGVRPAEEFSAGTETRIDEIARRHDQKEGSGDAG